MKCYVGPRTPDCQCVWKSQTVRTQVSVPFPHPTGVFSGSFWDIFFGGILFHWTASVLFWGEPKSPFSNSLGVCSELPHQAGRAKRFVESTIIVAVIKAANMAVHTQQILKRYKWAWTQESSVSGTCLKGMRIVSLSLPTLPRLAQRRTLLREGQNSSHGEVNVNSITLLALLPFAAKSPLAPPFPSPIHGPNMSLFSFCVSPDTALVSSPWWNGGIKQSKLWVHSFFLSLKVTLKPQELSEPWESGGGHMEGSHAPVLWCFLSSCQDVLRSLFTLVNTSRIPTWSQRLHKYQKCKNELRCRFCPKVGRNLLRKTDIWKTSFHLKEPQRELSTLGFL